MEEENKYFTVKQLSDNIDILIRSEINFNNIVIIGEISGINYRKCLFFKLKDNDGKTKNDAISIDCISFDDDVINDYNNNQYKDGDIVIIFGSLSWYKKSGCLRLVAKSIRRNGEGAFEKELLERRERLEKEGYFDNKYKKRIPKFLKNICVLTSLDGEVKNDIINGIRKINNIIDLYFVNVMVQGVNAPKSIIESLRIVDKIGFDCILIARGGGSKEDLLCFSDENLVKEVFKAKTLIASAIGHSNDETLLDLVADIRYETPSFAGSHLAYNVSEIIDQIGANIKEVHHYSNYAVNTINSTYGKKISDISKEVSRKIDNKISEIKYILQNTKVNISHNVDNFDGKIRNNILNIQDTIKHLVETISNRFDSVVSQIKLLNPDKILKRGYYRIENSKGESIMNIDNIKVGDKITIVSLTKKAKAQIEEIK